jgi:tetratricopeptide (TPR) repeat protein
VPALYPGSPLADDALYQLAQSYERQAEKLAAVTGEKAKQEAFVGGQRAAYQEWNKNQFAQDQQLAERRVQLKAGGKGKELALEEAYQASRSNGMNNDNIRNIILVAEQKAETDSAMQVANRQDRINEAYRQAVGLYTRSAAEYPLGDTTDKSLLRMAQIYETQLKDRKAAMDTYQKVVKFFPGTPQSEDAAWKVAKFYEQEGNYDQAVSAYKDFVRSYPGSGRVADAQFAMAEALEQLGRWVEAMDAYQTFRDKFTTHPNAARAEDQIKWIKAYR